MTWPWHNKQLDRIEKEVGQANQKLDQIIQLLTSHDITSLVLTVDPPVKEKRQMAIHTLGMAAALTAMLDDQKTTVHVSPLEAGKPVPLPAGMTVTWVSSDTTLATVDPSVDITGAPSTDPLAAVVFGVHGATGDPIITASVTNPDSTVASGTAPFHITVDPAELDITDLAVTVDVPVKQ